MRIRNIHPWQVSASEAADIQRHLAAQVSTSDSGAPAPGLVAGVDISPPDALGFAQGAVVVLSYPELEPVEIRTARERPSFPYVPGFLSFRESPVLLKPLEELSVEPDLLLVDGQGLAHPRRFGIACHLGLLLDRPTVGCAKSILVGRHGPLAPEAGSTAELVYKGQTIGIALRTKTGATPIYVSVGHRISLPTAVRWVLACCRGYRLPEPTRLAHLAAAGRLEEPWKVKRGPPPGQPALL